MDINKCTDSNEKLFLYNYTHCDNESESLIKECRGIIKTSDGKIIVQTFNYTDEYLDTDAAGIHGRIQNIDEWHIRYSMEGTLIRVFYYDNEWYISTHKKLNAFKSRWSCRDTFGDIFRMGLQEVFGSECESDVLQEFLARLDKSKIYVFLLRSNHENRIVCQAHYVGKREQIVYVGFFTTPDFAFVLNNGVTESSIVDDVGDGSNDAESWLRALAAPKATVPVTTVDDLIALAGTVNPFEYQGLIMFHKQSRDHFKIVHHKYHDLSKLRDNNPNLRFRYLELRQDAEKIQQLYALYPRFADMFDDYEDILHKIARMILHFYVSRYIKNKYVTLPREEYLVMKKCHEWYLSDRVNNRIFTAKIMEFLNMEPPLNLYKMIRRFLANQPRDNWHVVIPQQTFRN